MIYNDSLNPESSFWSTKSSWSSPHCSQAVWRTAIPPSMVPHCKRNCAHIMAWQLGLKKQMVVGDWKYWEYLWLLVVWCLFPYLLLFHSVGNLIIPIDELIFFTFFRGGRYTTNQNMLGVKPPRSCGLSRKLHNPQWCFWAESQRFAAHRQDELSNVKQRPFSPVLFGWNPRKMM